ncbi:hypothetical protein GCM10010507_03060 [Streptomyces cinnamoneus]|uniref:Uncharacterized protein n=1 Tax=Streptomyces cinnamoneus TaxID=53446 RepID=A0A918TBV4_STRCJ|nr:hypothetical protein GCM10010507_03060 [Streptomyces cinnamoneus]
MAGSARRGRRGCAKIRADDKTPPPRRGGPGGRRTLPPPGRLVDISAPAGMEDPSTAGRWESSNSLASLGVKPLRRPGILRLPEPDRSSFTGG